MLSQDCLFLLNTVFLRFIHVYQCDDACMHSRFSHVQHFVTPWTGACQAPLSMGFSRQEYWSGLPCPPPGDLPNPGIEPPSLKSPTLARGFFTTSATSCVCVLVAELCPTLCNSMDCSCQVPLSMKFSRQDYWSGLPFLSPRELPDSGIEPGSPALHTDSLPSEPPQKYQKATS